MDTNPTMITEKENGEQPWRETFDMIDALVDQNRMEAASDECLRLAKARPHDSEMLYHCAGTVSMGREDQASELRGILANHLQEFPDDFLVRQVHAILLSIEHRRAEALSEFLKVPEEKLREDVRWMRFKTLLEAGPVTLVCAWIENSWPELAERLKKEDFRNYRRFLWDVSGWQADHGLLQEAVAGYEQLLRLDPYARKAWLDYGGILENLGRPDDAAAAYEKGLNLTVAEVSRQSTYPGVVGYNDAEEQKFCEDLRKRLKRLKWSADKS